MTDGSERANSNPDRRTPYQKAIDMAWRTENIDHLLRQRGDPVKADMAAHTMLDALIVLDPSDTEGAEAITVFLGSLVEECDGYDSGARKFEQPPKPTAL